MSLSRIGNHRVLMVSPRGAQKPVGTGLLLPNGLWRWMSGRCLIADTGNNGLMKSPGGAPEPWGSGLSIHRYVAGDGAGKSHQRIKAITGREGFADGTQTPVVVSRTAGPQGCGGG